MGSPEDGLLHTFCCTGGNASNREIIPLWRRQDGRGGKCRFCELPERETRIAGWYLCSGDMFLDQTAAAGDVCSDWIPYVGSLCNWSLPRAQHGKGIRAGLYQHGGLLGDAGEAVEPSFSLQALEPSPNKHVDVMQCFAWSISKRIHFAVR